MDITINKEFRTKREAIWKEDVLHKIQRPTKLNDDRVEQANQFEEALHVIVSNKSFLEEDLLSVEQQQDAKDKIAKMVVGFEKDLSIIVEPWSAVPSRKTEAKERLEKYCKDIKDIAENIQEEKRFFKDIQYMSKKSLGRIRTISDIGWYFYEEDEIDRKSLRKDKKYVRENREVALDYNRNRTDRDDAYDNIRECYDWLQEMRNEGFEAYADDLSERMWKFKDCFGHYRDHLSQRPEGEELLRTFREVYEECRFYKNKTLEQNSDWMTSDFMLNTFDPKVREMEGMGLELLRFQEHYRSGTFDQNTPYYDSLAGLLERATTCEEQRSVAQGGALSTQFRDCHYYIMRAVHAWLRPDLYPQNTLQDALS
ncbi:MAG TPA: hypothetical protein VGL94_20810 [Ktedonobacteraceae bacterium]